jgi:hypothetical protein
MFTPRQTHYKVRPTCDVTSSHLVDLPCAAAFPRQQQVDAGRLRLVHSPSNGVAVARSSARATMPVQQLTSTSYLTALATRRGD